MQVNFKFKHIGLFCCLICVCLLTNIGNAASGLPRPLLQFREDIPPDPNPGGTHPGGVGVSANEPITGYTFIFFNTFYRMLNALQAEIIVSGDNYARFPDDYRYSVKNISKSHSLLIYEHLTANWDNSSAPRKVRARALYPIDKITGRSIGYCIMEPWQFDINGPRHNLPVSDMRKLPLDTAFLDGKLEVPVGVSMTHYAQRHHGYVERYTLISYRDRDYGNLKFMLLDAFYPENLESRFEMPMQKYLQKQLKYHGQGVMFGGESNYEESLMNIGDFD
jgi:hypothetical protein